MENFKKDFYQNNYFTNKYDDGYKLIDVNNINELSNIFLKMIKEKYNISCSFNDLSNLHLIIDDQLKIIDQTYGLNKFTKNIAELNQSFKSKYIEILKTGIRDFIGENFYFQQHPTLRVFFPHSTLDSFYPVYHSDLMNGHPPYEINLWLPLNSPSKSEGYGFALNSLKKSVGLFEEYNFDIDKMRQNNFEISLKFHKSSIVQNFKYGKVSLFDAKKLHSTLPLKNYTRVSVDARIVIVSVMTRTKKYYKSLFGRRPVIYKPGSYYNNISIDEMEI